MCRNFWNGAKRSKNAAGVLAVVAMVLLARPPMEAQTALSLSPGIFNTPFIASSFPGSEVLVKPIGSALTEVRSPAGGGSGTQVVGVVANDAGVSGTPEITGLTMSAGADFNSGSSGGGSRSSSYGLAATAQTASGLRSNRGGAVRYGLASRSMLASGDLVPAAMAADPGSASAESAGGSGHPFTAARSPMSSANGLSGRSFDNPPMPDLNVGIDSTDENQGYRSRLRVTVAAKAPASLAPLVGAQLGAASITKNRDLARGRSRNFKGLGQNLPDAGVPKVGVPKVGVNDMQTPQQP